MIKELFYKWFGIEPFPCPTCEVLRAQLEDANRERRQLLQTILEKDKSAPEPVMTEEDFKPIKPNYVPWRVRQQMLEAEDRRKAQLLSDKNKEVTEAQKQSIEKLEKELEIKEA